MLRQLHHPLALALSAPSSSSLPLSPPHATPPPPLFSLLPLLPATPPARAELKQLTSHTRGPNWARGYIQLGAGGIEWRGGDEVEVADEMMLAASDDHIHGAGVGVGEEKRRAVEEMKRKKNTEHRAHHMEDKEKQGVLMTSIMCALGC